jgi:inosine-uridine nucleoside N-ribohydrolase
MTPVILDTDIGPDCDDVGAVAVLHTLARLGEANILGMVCDTTSEWGPRCLSALNAYYGCPALPVGALKGPGHAGGDAGWSGETYNRAIAERFPHATDFPDAVDLYRRLLETAEDDSVTIVSIGMMTNLRNLLASSGGMELVRQKVRTLVAMAARFPSGPPECNFACDIPAAIATVRDWPTPVVFAGSEVGEQVRTGARLKHELPPNHPVRTAYELWDRHFVPTWDPAFDLSEIYPHASYDQLAVLYAVRTHATYWRVERGGQVHVFEDGSCEWRSGEGQHAYLILEGEVAKIEAEIDDLMIGTT